jgi:hypothetical protein
MSALWVAISRIGAKDRTCQQMETASQAAKGVRGRHRAKQGDMGIKYGFVGSGSAVFTYESNRAVCQNFRYALLAKRIRASRLSPSTP